MLEEISANNFCQFQWWILSMEVLTLMRRLLFKHLWFSSKRTFFFAFHANGKCEIFHSLKKGIASIEDYWHRWVMRVVLHLTPAKAPAALDTTNQAAVVHGWVQGLP
jgi:hypothetical protein